MALLIDFANKINKLISSSTRYRYCSYVALFAWLKGFNNGMYTALSAPWAGDFARSYQAHQGAA